MQSFLGVIHITQLANIGPCDVSRSSPSNVPWTFPKDPIWPSRGRQIRYVQEGSPNLTSWGSLKMTSRGRPDLTFKGRPWEVNSGSPQDVVRTIFFWLFFQNLYGWPNLSESISTLKVYWEPCGTCKMEYFLKN